MTSTAKLALAALAAAFLALPGRAQDAEEPPEAETAEAPAGEGVPEATEPAEGEQPEAGAGGPVVVDEEEGSVLDDQTFEGEDDDFIPTEQIPVDEPIPFPTDI